MGRDPGTGDPWPTKDVRMARLRECVEVMRALWRGEEVTYRGLVTVDRARVWSLPEEPPRLVAGAISPQTAAWAAEWADGLITVNQPPELLRKVVDAYRDAGGRGDLHLQVHLSWAHDEDTALAVAHDKWRANCLPTSLAWELETPEQFAQWWAQGQLLDVERHAKREKRSAKKTPQRQEAEAADAANATDAPSEGAGH